LRRFWCVAIVVAISAPACKIQRTPQEYIDHRTPVQQVRQSAEEELTSVVAVLNQSLARGDLEGAIDVLQIAPDGYLVTSDGRPPREGDAAVREAVREWAAAAQPVRLTDSRVTVGPARLGRLADAPHRGGGRHRSGQPDRGSGEG
jgi:hypothetical protein